MDGITALLAEQDGVIGRRQVLLLGGDDDLVRRRVRRREWARIHEGVYVNHTGEPTWTQRLWAALLFYGDAVVCDESVLALAGCRTGATRDSIHVALDPARRVARLPGVRVHRTRLAACEVLEHLSPPRLRLEPALVRVASRARTDADAVAVLGDACQQRMTTPSRLEGAVRRRTRLPRRRFLLTLLEDVAAGTYSVLEHRYLTRVERPHGLPTAKRQRVVRCGRTAAYRDVEYLLLATVVELDGRLGHEASADRWDDLDRDIGAAREGRTTVRLGWGQIADPCRTAAAVTALLRLRGWAGAARKCSSGCAVGPDDGDSQVSSA